MATCIIFLHSILFEVVVYAKEVRYFFNWNVIFYYFY